MDRKRKTTLGKSCSESRIYECIYWTDKPGIQNGKHVVCVCHFQVGGIIIFVELGPDEDFHRTEFDLEIRKKYDCFLNPPQAYIPDGFLQQNLDFLDGLASLYYVKRVYKSNKANRILHFHADKANSDYRYLALLCKNLELFVMKNPLDKQILMSSLSEYGLQVMEDVFKYQDWSYSLSYFYNRDKFINDCSACKYYVYEQESSSLALEKMGKILERDTFMHYLLYESFSSIDVSTFTWNEIQQDLIYNYMAQRVKKLYLILLSDSASFSEPVIRKVIVWEREKG